MAPDSSTQAATVPPQRGGKASVAQLEYQMLHAALVRQFSAMRSKRA